MSFDDKVKVCKDNIELLKSMLDDNKRVYNDYKKKKIETKSDKEYKMLLLMKIQV